MNMTVDSDSVRFAAEWEPHGAVMLAWPHSQTDWAYMLDEVRDCYRRIVEALLAAGSKVIILAHAGESPQFANPNVVVIHVETNDTWIRDYGPLSLFRYDTPEALLDFRFNAWGQKFPANFDNQTTRGLAALMALVAPIECHKDFVLEGGSVESDGCGTILTTTCCLMAPNRNEPMTREQIEAELLRRLHARKVLWLNHGALIGDDTDGHIDTLCRLAPQNTILFTACHNPVDPHFAPLEAMRRDLEAMTDADGHPFNLFELPIPDPVYDPDDGSRLPATYANFLVTDSAVLLPTYHQPLNDKLAADTLQMVYPTRRIIPVDCRPLLRQHGSLHCATMQIPVGFSPFFV